MSINRTAEYMVLWKSHKRAEWAAVGLDNQAEALRQRLGRDDVAPRPAATPSASTGKYQSAAEGAAAVAVMQRAAAAPADSIDSTAGVPAEISDELERLEIEGRRMWELHTEIGAELSQVAKLLTVAQSKSAQKVLQQWEETESVAGA